MTVRNAANVEELDRVGLVTDTAAEDLRHVMLSPQGRRFLWSLLGTCGIYRISFNHSGSITSFNEGMRNVGLDLQRRMIEASSELYLAAQAEAVALADKERQRPTEGQRT